MFSMKLKALALATLAVAALSATPSLARDRDGNPPGWRGGPGTNWENPPGWRGGPGAAPDRRFHRPWWARPGDNNPPGRVGGPGTDWENPPGWRGGPGASPNRRPFTWSQFRR